MLNATMQYLGYHSTVDLSRHRYLTKGQSIQYLWIGPSHECGVYGGPPLQYMYA